MIREIRDICRDEGGYVKLMQFVFVLLILTCFFLLLIYNLFLRETTSKLDIFLTVIVGLMGTIMGTFFSERTMESIKKDRDIKRKAIIKKITGLKERRSLLEELREKLN